MKKYNKGLAAALGGILTVIYMQWGEVLDLPAGWPETTAALLLPVLLPALAAVLSPKNED
jgi:hypothetical protein